MDGLLLVDKPSGWTSFDVVAKVRNILRTANRKQQLGISNERLISNSSLLVSSPKVKVGHTGTLDPLATGLLVLVLGTYCKRASEFSKLDKVYEVTMKLGESSTTGDAEGVINHISSEKPTNMQINDAIASFIGVINQVPPAYSAIKVNGQRAYKLARAGQEVKLEPREVTVYSLQITDYSYPEVTFTAEVSSGTYIRSLVEDIGKALGTGAYMSALRRTEIGEFQVTDALGIDDLDYQTLATKLVSIY